VSGDTVVERLTDRCEPGSAVEVERAEARMTPNEVGTVGGRVCNECIEHAPPPPLAAEAMCGGHSPDAPGMIASRRPRRWIGTDCADGYDLVAGVGQVQTRRHVQGEWVVVAAKTRRVHGETSSQNCMAKRPNHGDADRLQCDAIMRLIH
jgi:hypothetical protein